MKNGWLNITDYLGEKGSVIRNLAEDFGWSCYRGGKPSECRQEDLLFRGDLNSVINTVFDIVEQDDRLSVKDRASEMIYKARMALWNTNTHWRHFFIIKFDEGDPRKYSRHYQEVLVRSSNFLDRTLVTKMPIVRKDFDDIYKNLTLILDLENEVDFVEFWGNCGNNWSLKKSSRGSSKKGNYYNTLMVIPSKGFLADLQTLTVGSIREVVGSVTQGFIKFEIVNQGVVNSVTSNHLYKMGADSTITDHTLSMIFKTDFRLSRNSDGLGAFDKYLSSLKTEVIMAPPKKDPTVLLSFRVDQKLTEEFEVLCKKERRNGYDEIRRYMEVTVEAGRLPMGEDEMIPKDVLDERIEEALNQQNRALRLADSSPTYGTCSNISNGVEKALKPFISFIEENYEYEEELSLCELEHHTNMTVNLLRSFSIFFDSISRGEINTLSYGVAELQEFQKFFAETFSSKDYKSFKGWAKKVDESVESTKSLRAELTELKALIGNLTKPQESEELPYEQRLIYNSERKYEWNGHAFRSEQEVRIAKALDARNVLFIPNAGCRVDEDGVRKTREVDFLVITDKGKGVLECDGRSFHKIAADDHERDRNFQRQGIKFIQRYDYNACLNADKVVDDFLKLMENFYNA